MVKKGSNWDSVNKIITLKSLFLSMDHCCLTLSIDFFKIKRLIELLFYCTSSKMELTETGNSVEVQSNCGRRFDCRESKVSLRNSTRWGFGVLSGAV